MVAPRRPLPNPYRRRTPHPHHSGNRGHGHVPLALIAIVVGLGFIAYQSFNLAPEIPVNNNVSQWKKVPDQRQTMQNTAQPPKPKGSKAVPNVGSSPKAVSSPKDVPNQAPKFAPKPPTPLLHQDTQPAPAEKVKQQVSDEPSKGVNDPSPSQESPNENSADTSKMEPVDHGIDFNAVDKVTGGLANISDSSKDTSIRNKSTELKSEAAKSDNATSAIDGSQLPATVAGKGEHQTGSSSKEAASKPTQAESPLSNQTPKKTEKSSAETTSEKLKGTTTMAMGRNTTLKNATGAPASNATRNGTDAAALNKTSGDSVANVKSLSSEGVQNKTSVTGKKFFVVSPNATLKARKAKLPAPSNTTELASSSTTVTNATSSSKVKGSEGPLTKLPTNKNESMSGKVAAVNVTKQGKPLDRNATSSKKANVSGTLLRGNEAKAATRMTNTGNKKAKNETSGGVQSQKAGHAGLLQPKKAKKLNGTGTDAKPGHSHRKETNGRKKDTDHSDPKKKPTAEKNNTKTQGSKKTGQRNETKTGVKLEGNATKASPKLPQSGHNETKQHTGQKGIGRPDGKSKKDVEKEGTRTNATKSSLRIKLNETNLDNARLSRVLGNTTEAGKATFSAAKKKHGDTTKADRGLVGTAQEKKRDLNTTDANKKSSVERRL